MNEAVQILFLILFKVETYLSIKNSTKIQFYGGETSGEEPWRVGAIERFPVSWIRGGDRMLS